jgi:hypothetical protein
MQSFRLIANENPFEIPVTNKKKYFSKRMNLLKEKLEKSKSKLDALWSPEFAKKWRKLDPFYTEKTFIAEITNTKSISNAWIKCNELLIHYNLLPQKVESEFVHFDNAAFPGSFLVCTSHLVASQFNWYALYKWYGSSLLLANRDDSKPLEDDYNLYKDYPGCWLMTAEDNGDVTKGVFHQNVYKRLHNKVDLYTSDLGFNFSKDYNEQELTHLPANIGQILSSLLTLKIGGCSITKQYMTFSTSLIAIMYCVSCFFEEFYLCKPYSSRDVNSETYLVGKKLKYQLDLDSALYRTLLDVAEGRTPPDIPIIAAENIPKSFLKSMYEASEAIFNYQINKLEEHILICTKLHKFPDFTLDLYKWYNTYPIKYTDVNSLYKNVIVQGKREDNTIKFIKQKFNKPIDMSLEAYNVLTNREPLEVSHLPTCDEDILKDENYVFSRKLVVEYKKLPYVNNKLSFHKALHWGQLKLLHSEIEYLTEVLKDTNKRVIVLYIGAAHGYHIDILLDMFEKFEFHLYDINKIFTRDPAVKYQKYFEEDDAKYWANFKKENDCYLAFISDIRTEPATEDSVKYNMQQQKEWAETIKPDSGYFKFRLPWSEGKTQYFKGDIYIQAYPPKNSTETRLLFKTLDLVDYDNKTYEEQLFYHNTVVRKQKCTVPNILKPMLDDCYDCCSLYVVVRDYLNLVGSKVDVRDFIEDMLSKILKHYSTNMKNRTKIMLISRLNEIRDELIKQKIVLY